MPDPERVICPICGYINRPSFRVCHGCAAPLGLDANSSSDTGQPSVGVEAQVRRTTAPLPKKCRRRFIRVRPRMGCWVVLTGTVMLCIVIVVAIVSIGINENQTRHTVSPLYTVSPLSLEPNATATISNGADGQKKEEGEDIRSYIPTETFSMSSSHQTPPKDVLREVNFWVGGSSHGSCYHHQDIAIPTLVYGSDNTELRRKESVVTCGWRSDELVHITMEYPNGNLIQQDQRSDGFNGTYFMYETDLGDPTGYYTITFEGQSEIVHHSVYVSRPTEPRLYWENDGELLLYNFEPNENVRVFAYAPELLLQAVLVAWQEFQVSSDGQLLLAMDDDLRFPESPQNDLTCIVLGDTSGELPCPGVVLLESIQRVSCVVANTGDQLLDVTAREYRNSQVIARVPSGTRMEVIENISIGGPVFWKVRLNDGTEGWVDDEGVKRIVE